MLLTPVVDRARAAETAAIAVAAAVRRPELLSADEVLDVYERLERASRAIGAAKILLARRVDETGEAQRQGMASGAELLARLSGTSVGAARSDLATSAALSDLEETADAMVQGEVSPEQGKVIAGAAKRNPTAQRRLLKKARTGTHRDLHQEAQRVRAEADPNAEARHRRIHSKRSLSMWTDDEGVWHLSAVGTVTDGAAIRQAIERETDRVFREQASAAHHEPRGAYAFDAMKHLTTQPPRPADGKPPRQPAPQHLALLRLDVAALRRGMVEDGELCEIAGVGTIPVSVAKALLGDAVLKLLITDGVDVLNVTSLTRGPTQAMRYATLWTSPGCIVEGCDRTICEYDHRTGTEYKDTRHTRLDELDHPCTHHHDLHTKHGWALVAGTGKRAMVPPGHPDHPTLPGEGRPPPMSDQDLVEIAEHVRIAKEAIRPRTTGRQPPDTARGPAPPDLVGATPSLFG